MATMKRGHKVVENDVAAHLLEKLRATGATYSQIAREAGISYKPIQNINAGRPCRETTYHKLRTLEASLTGSIIRKPQPSPVAQPSLWRQFLDWLMS